MNVIVLGALLKIRGTVKKESVMTALKKRSLKDIIMLLPLNEQALMRGMELVNN